MAVGPRSIGRIGGRRTTITVLLIIWLGVVVIGAGPATDSATWIGIPSLDWINYVFAGLMVLGAVVLIASLATMSGNKDSEPTRKRPIWPVLLVALLFLILARREPAQPEGDAAAAPPPVEVVEPEPNRGSDRSGGVGAQELAVLIAILAAAVGVVLWGRRELLGDGAADDPLSLEQALAPAMKRAAEQLLTGTDPRSAVLMAYRSLETALERQGLPRDETETPAEHLERVLADLPLDTAPLITLSELYLQARYSTHPVTADDQRSAATSLERVREQLATATNVDHQDDRSADHAGPQDRRR